MPACRQVLVDLKFHRESYIEMAESLSVNRLGLAAGDVGPSVMML
jgi:hypothetical protein